MDLFTLVGLYLLTSLQKDEDKPSFVSTPEQQAEWERFHQEAQAFFESQRRMQQ